MSHTREVPAARKSVLDFLPVIIKEPLGDTHELDNANEDDPGDDGQRGDSV